MTFHIDIEKTKEFWHEASYQDEKDMLFDEWKPEPVMHGSNISRYKKRFYGINFAIQFNYEKK
jgi:hypothetical protein